MPTPDLTDKPLELIQQVLASETARHVLGHLSTDDLNTLADAKDAGTLKTEALKVLKDAKPRSVAQDPKAHDVAKVLNKLPDSHLKALATAAAACP